MVGRKFCVRSNFIEEWTALCDTLPKLGTISVIFSQRRGAHEPGTYYSQPEFTPERRLHDDIGYQWEMKRGQHDDKHSWTVSRLGLDHLASILKDSSREKTQGWLTSRCEFTSRNTCVTLTQSPPESSMTSSRLFTEMAFLLMRRLEGLIRRITSSRV